MEAVGCIIDTAPGRQNGNPGYVPKNLREGDRHYCGSGFPAAAGFQYAFVTGTPARKAIPIARATSPSIWARTGECGKTMSARMKTMSAWQRPRRPADSILPRTKARRG